MGIMIKRMSFLKELVLAYSFFTIIGGSIFLFVYFLAALRTPDFWLGVIVFNALWIMTLYSAVKSAYIKGLSDSMKKMPSLQETVQ